MFAFLFYFFTLNRPLVNARAVAHAVKKSVPVLILPFGAILLQT